jgi:outer membrane immunogenic protein
MFYKLMSSACILGFLAAPALAADMFDASYGQNNTYANTGVPGASWGGVYGGLVAGYGWGEAGPLDTDGGVLGATLGYNWQHQSFVLGAEGDMSLFNVGSRGPFGKFDHRWMGTARVRAGYAFDRFLVFGTGGFASTTTKFRQAGVGGDSETHYGWTLGAGMEAAITDRISAKVDYLYTNFDTKAYSIGPGNVRVNPDTSTLRAGVNYRF